MVGAKLQTRDCASRVMSPGASRYALPETAEYRTGAHRLRVIGLLSVLIPLSFLLVQCGRAPSAGTLAANVQASSGDSFDDRFPAPQFRDRFPTPGESLPQQQSS